jgi:hypothetical protein
MKLRSAIIASLLFGFLLLAGYYIHVAYFRVDVVFFAALTDGLIAATLSGLFLFATTCFAALGRFEKAQLIVIWLLAGYAFAISVPTVIDRSLSFYILEKLQQRGGGIKQESFEQVFAQEYVKEHRLVHVRLTEQPESGTITIEDGCVKLTNRGDALATFSRYFRKHWLPKQRLLMGRYSDDLTDLFRDGVDSPGYTCR